jgi:hypothetical protein
MTESTWFPPFRDRETGLDGTARGSIGGEPIAGCAQTIWTIEQYAATCEIAV